MANLGEVALTQPEQGGAVEFRVAADIVVDMWMERLAVFVLPQFLRVIACFDIHRTRTPIILFTRHVVAAFEDEDALPGWRERVRQGGAARASAGCGGVGIVCCR